MFFLKSLYGKVWNDTNSTELAQISTGQLFLVRPGSIQGSRECLFNIAMATIRRSTQEFNFQLVVTRVFEEGEEQLLDEDEETEDERSFLIDEQLSFRVGEFEGEPAFRWRDMQGDVNDQYEFVATGTNEPTSTFFETCMYKAMWERKYSRSAEEASDKDLREFVYTEQLDVKQELESNSHSLSTQTAKAMTNVPITSGSHATTPRHSTARSSGSGRNNLNETAELYWWDEEKAAFDCQGACEAHITKSQPFTFNIAVKQDRANILYHPVTSDCNGRFTSKLLSFTWNHIGRDGRQSSWCLQFATEAFFLEWKVSYTKALYETLNHSSWDKIKEVERQYIIQSHEEDIVMKDADEEEEEEEEEEEVQAELKESESESEDESNDGQGHSDDSPSLPKGKNEMLTVGFNKNRSYVVRSGGIGVFKSRDDGKMEHHGTLPSIKDLKGKEFTPKKIMLHDQDNAMVLMDPRQPNALFKMDIERGKVVEEWKVDDNIPVLHMAPESKFAQTQLERTILGASGNALFRIDPRLPGSKLVDSEFKQYASPNKFSGLTTTEAGQVAVASEKGDIRLFDKVGKNAKTALPAMGDPILGVDVTKDGRWVVATCRTYLLVIDTLIPEGRYAGLLGFDRSFPADAKPAPKRLRLQNAHVQYMGGNVTFSPARFDMDESQEETSIVTSSGNYVIAWDFKAIKRGKYDKYEIRKYQDVVVQDQFKYGDKNDIVVALENNVVMINKKHLKNPTQPKSYGEGRRHSSNKIAKSSF